MVIRSHSNRFWFRLTPGRSRQLRYPLHATATSLITERVPASVSGWLFRMRRDVSNRTALGRQTLRLMQRRRRRRRALHLRMAVKAPQRLFVPRRLGIHDGPVR